MSVSRLDKLIAAARELATEVKERTVAVAQSVVDRVEQLRVRFERWREQQTEARSEQQLDPQKGSRTQEKQELQRAGPGQAMDSQIEQRLQAFRERYEANKQAREPAVVNAALDLQKRTDAAIQKLEAERAQLQGTRAGLERNAVQAFMMPCGSRAAISDSRL
jgi:hypothetical protein